MNLYKNLPEEIQDKIDINIQSNIKEFVQHNIFHDLEKFHKQRIRSQIFDYYNEWKKHNNFFISNRIIENDLLMWLNHPFSQNMDDPFMYGINTQRFIRVMNRAFPSSSIIINESQYKFITKNLSGKQIINRILNALTIQELEKFFTYQLRWIGKCTQKHIVQIPLGQHNYL